MKILLVRPVTDEKLILNVVPPIGLGYLATALLSANFEVKLVDCVLKRLSHDDLMEHVVEYQPDVVGFSMFSHDVPSVKRSASLIKTRFPKAVIVLGGAHPSAMPKETLRIVDDADYSFKGEAEEGFPRLLEALNCGNDKGVRDVPGISYRDGEEVVCNPPCLPRDLDKIGFPSWDLLDPRLYPLAPQGMMFKKAPIAPIIVTRGCPFPCTFCAGHTVTGKKTRFRSVENVISEIRYLHQQYGVNEIHILDDNFTLKRDFVRDFCEELIHTGMEISWCCPNGIRMDLVDLELLKLMKKAGCHYISVGIESGSRATLKRMKKKLTPEKIALQVDLIRRSGLPVNGFFILGYPGETREDILETIRFARSLGLTRAAFFNFMPLPGSEIFRELLDKGEVTEMNWNEMFEAYVPYSPKGISRGELKALQRRAHLEFYLRPRAFLQLIANIRSLEHFRFVARRALAYLFSKN